jgi:hypothetical protein
VKSDGTGRLASTKELIDGAPDDPAQGAEVKRG